MSALDAMPGSGKGYIYLDRILRDSWLWDANDFDFVVAIKLIMMANYKPGEFEGTIVPRGSLVRSIASLTRDLGGQATVKKVRLSLRKLSNAKYLSVESKQGKRFSLITILNYDKYQSMDDATERSNGELRANFGRTSGEKRATIEESKKGRREEGKNQLPLLDSPSSTPPLGIDPSRFEEAYSYYPRKASKKSGMDKLPKLVKTEKEFNVLRKAIWAMHKAWNGYDTTTCPHWGTFVNQERWKDEELPLPSRDTPRKPGAGPARMPEAKNQAPSKDDRPKGSGQTNEEWEAAMAEKLKAMGINE